MAGPGPSRRQFDFGPSPARAPPGPQSCVVTRGAWAGSWYPRRLAQSRPGSIASRTGASLCPQPACCLAPYHAVTTGEGQQRTVWTQSPRVRAWERWSPRGGGEGGWCPDPVFSCIFQMFGKQGSNSCPYTPRAPGSSSSQGWEINA